MNIKDIEKAIDELLDKIAMTAEAERMPLWVKYVELQSKLANA